MAKRPLVKAGETFNGKHQPIGFVGLGGEIQRVGRKRGGASVGRRVYAQQGVPVH